MLLLFVYNFKNDKTLEKLIRQVKISGGGFAHTSHESSSQYASLVGQSSVELQVP
jgi:hypothetical protein